MNIEAFRQYLLEVYDPNMSEAAASSILARCGRVEKELGVDLDDMPDVTVLHDDAPQVSGSKNVQADIRSALNRYQEFKKDR